MSITLVTGACGEGKTAYCVNYLVEEYKKPENFWRPLFVHGVPELKLPHTPVRCKNDQCDVCPPDKEKLEYAIEDWFLWSPKGAFIFIDEGHFPFPSETSKENPTLKLLTTHRKKGIDFLAITQTPILLNDGFKKLANKHIHLQSSWARRKLIEWGHHRSDTSNKTGGVEKTYVLPKQVFGLYKSASLHTKLSRTTPPQILIILLLALASSFIGYRIFNSISSKISPPEKASPLPTPSQNTKASQQNIPSNFDYFPKIAYVPESAPIYDGLPKPKSFPQLKGCVLNKRTNDCKCYTQQATIYEVSQDMCINYINVGKFNPYKQDEVVQPVERESVANSEPAVQQKTVVPGLRTGI